MSDEPVRLLPMVDDILGLEHGERGLMDDFHPDACLCGWPNYMECPHFADGMDALMGITLYPPEVELP